MEEELRGNQGEGERDDEGREEEGLKETGDHCRPAKRTYDSKFEPTMDLHSAPT